MQYLSLLKCIIIFLAFCFGESKAEIFATDVKNVIWLPQPQVNDNCARVMRQMDKKTSFYGFSISIDDSNDSLFVGAPGCNGLYECKNFRNCRDVSERIYSSNNPGESRFSVILFQALLILSLVSLE